jgi:U3 small nucleolar RNA-associated protein 14
MHVSGSISGISSYKELSYAAGMYKTTETGLEGRKDFNEWIQKAHSSISTIMKKARVVTKQDIDTVQTALKTNKILEL